MKASVATGMATSRPTKKASMPTKTISASSATSPSSDQRYPRPIRMLSFIASIRTQIPIDDDYRREHEEEHGEDSWNDQQDETDADGEPDQDRCHQELPEGPRMPQRRQVHRLRIVVGGEKESRDAHAHEGAEDKVDETTDQ